MRLSPGQRRVLEAIRDGARNGVDIGELAGLTNGAGGTAITRLLKLGLIREYGRLSWPSYELTGTGRAALGGPPGAQDRE